MFALSTACLAAYTFLSSEGGKSVLPASAELITPARGTMCGFARKVSEKAREIDVPRQIASFVLESRTL